MYKVLIYGGKGYILDGEAEYMPVLNDDPYKDYFMNCLNLHHGEYVVNALQLGGMDAVDFLKSDLIGGDFLNSNDPYERVLDFMNMDTISKYLHIDTSRYYVGRKSMRMEYKKFSNLVRDPIDKNQIMRLSLMAGLSKGYDRFYIQNDNLADSIFVDTLMKKYIDINDVLTWHPDRVWPKYENTGLDDFDQPIDSSFYHLTLLQNFPYRNDSVFYVGILNKRCAPHLILNSGHPNYTDSVEFFSTAELEDSIAVNPDKWEKYYWERVGTRNIQFSFNRYTFGNKFQGLKITELGNRTRDTTNFDGWPYWEQERYKNRIDMAIHASQPLVVKLLPGEGKILKVEVSDSAYFVCNCDAVMPDDRLVIKKDEGDYHKCYVFEFDIYPCDNKTLEQMSIVLSNIPDCFKDSYNVYATIGNYQLEKGFVDFTTAGEEALINIPLGVIKNDTNKRFHVSITMCFNVDPGNKELCSQYELMQLTAYVIFSGLPCEKDMKVHMTEIMVTSVENFEEDYYKFFDSKYNDFLIRPNPTSGQLSLEFKDDINHPIDIYVLDINGQIMQSQIFEYISKDVPLSLDVESFTNGNYLIAIYSQGTLLKGKKFTVKR